MMRAHTLAAAHATLAAAGGVSFRPSPAPRHPRLVTLRFEEEGAPLLAALYRLGCPVQYSHLERPLDLWSVQTPWAARPWSVEPPSAGLPFTFGLLGALALRGVSVAPLTH